MRLFAALLAALLLASPLTAQRQQTLPRWSSEQKQGLVVALGAIALDCGSTAVALRQPGGYEQNPVLGRHPSDLKLAAGCLAAAGAVTLIADRLPRKTRGWWIGAVFAVEITMFAQNLAHLSP